MRSNTSFKVLSFCLAVRTGRKRLYVATPSRIQKCHEFESNSLETSGESRLRSPSARPLLSEPASDSLFFVARMDILSKNWPILSIVIEYFDQSCCICADAAGCASWAVASESPSGVGGWAFLRSAAAESVAGSPSGGARRRRPGFRGSRSSRRRLAGARGAWPCCRSDGLRGLGRSAAPRRTPPARGAPRR